MNMPDRLHTPFTNEHFAAWCASMVGQPYWYGTCCYRATKYLLKKKAARYPAHYGAGRRQRYQRDIAAKAVVADCVGACKGYAWTDGGQDVLEAIGTGRSYAIRYCANGCPDKGADTMFIWAKKQGASHGTIAVLPDVPGLALWKKGHLGYTLGGGEAVEWRGFRFGCVRTRIADRPWTHWFCLPFIDYGAADVAVPATLGSRTLHRGMKGADVVLLQEALNRLGAALTPDGRFGRQTEAAVRAFQKWKKIYADGVAGPRTYAVLAAAKNPDSEAAETK